MLRFLSISGALKGRQDEQLAVLKPSLGANLAPISLIFRSDVEQPRVVLAFTDIILDAAMRLELDRGSARLA